MLFRVVALAILCAGTLAAQLPPSARFVMSHFKWNPTGGDERLYISWSMDGLSWTAINDGNPVWQPPGWSPFWNVVRDPAIVFAGGAYWVCYTQGNYGRGSKFGLIRSTDLLNWTQVGPIDVPLPGATDPLTWSPSFFVDGDGSVHVFVSINPVGGAAYDPIPTMRIHETHPLDPGWTQWSVPVPLALPETNTNEFFCWKEGAVYHAVYIDFARGGALIHSISTELLSGWVLDRVLGYNSQEGPFVLPKPGGGYRVYLEPGNVAGTVPTHYRWSDFSAAFTSATAQALVSATVPMRNGKPCGARETLSFVAWQADQLASAPIEERGALADADADGLKNLVEHGLGMDPMAFTVPLRRPQPFLRTLSGGSHAGIWFDWLPASADAIVRPEVGLSDGSWSAAASDVAVESQTLLSDGTVRTFARTTLPIGTTAMLRVAVVQSGEASAATSQTFGVKTVRMRTKPMPSQKSPLR